MYEELIRSMNDAERSLLAELAASTAPPVSLGETVKWIFVWSSGIVLCAFAAGAPFFLRANAIVAGTIGGLLAIVGIVCLYAIISLIGGHVHWSRIQRDFVRYELPRIERALESGDVQVKKVSATAVITIVAWEDEGAGYIYDVGDGKTLFLKGQRYFPVQAEMPWPNTDFEIVRTAYGKIWVGVFCSGTALSPVREIETSQCVDDIVWEEREEVVEGDIELVAKAITGAG